MSIKTVRHRLLYFKDLFQGTTYTALSNSRWFATLTPVLAFVVRPLLGITLSTMALLQAWLFIHTPHKNIDGWMTTISALGGALFNNIAALGGFLARLQGTVFALSPWFFVAGFSVGALNQLTLASLNARRAYESPAGSDQRQHYVQSAIYNLVLAAQLASCVTAIVLFNLFPANTVLITAFALTVVSINIGSSIWRFMSSDSKKEIKRGFGFEKLEHLNENLAAKLPRKDVEPKHTRLFSTCDHCAVIRKMSTDDAKKYLLNYIRNKLSVLTKNEPSEKNKQKIEVLQILKQVLIKNKAMPHSEKLHHRYPRLADNFWCEKSDTQQLLDAVGLYHKKYNDWHEEKKWSSLAP